LITSTLWSLVCREFSIPNLIFAIVLMFLAIAGLFFASGIRFACVSILWKGLGYMVKFGPHCMLFT
jgi:hypothetical protein